MKRFLASILAIFTLLCVLASCNAVDKDEDNEPSKIADKTEDKASESETVSPEDEDNEPSKDADKTEDKASESETVSPEHEGTLYSRDEKNITFGSYPQSEVTDSALCSALNAKAGELPTEENFYSWTSYGYYADGAETAYMWYIDVEEGEERYRGVYFTKYRPDWTVNHPDSAHSYQDDNGYKTGSVYWFRYDPITWTILLEDLSEGKAFLFSNLVLDAQPYQADFTYDSESDEYFNSSEETPYGIHANNYEYSFVRKWLNETFFDTAFNELQKEIILYTEVDNSATSAGDSSSPYYCENTNDRIFLLSWEEAQSAEYGLGTYESREKKQSAYALAQGAYYNPSDGYKGNGTWWLRSPYKIGSYNASIITHVGNPLIEYVYYACRGVVPAMWINL